jgi:Ycf66 protein N-terminus
MLNDLLGWIVALGSLGLYLSRFFLPEVQRKNDAIWSGVGLFYALILWANGDRIKGGLLLGQMASVALIVWLGWQALQQRRQLAAPQDQTPLPESVQSSWPFVKTGLDRLVSTIKDGPASSPEIARGSSSEKKEFKIGGLTIPLDLSGLLATVKGSPSQETAAIPKTSSADGKDEDWGDEVVSEPATPQEPEPEPVAEATNESQVPEVIEETVEVVATEAVMPEVAIAPNEPEQPLEPPNTEEPDESAETSATEAIAKPEAVDVTTEADRNQPSSEADLSEDRATEETVETSSETPEEDSVAPAEAMQSAQEIPSELEPDAVAHEEAAHPPGSETDDGSWPPQDPVT